MHSNAPTSHSTTPKVTMPTAVKSTLGQSTSISETQVREPANGPTSDDRDPPVDDLAAIAPGPMDTITTSTPTPSPDLPTPSLDLPTPSSDLPTPTPDMTLNSDETPPEPGADSGSKHPAAQTKKIPKGKRFRPSQAQSVQCVL